MARLVPWAGNSADAAAAMADAGRSLSAAGITLVDAFRTLPDGIGSLAPQRGVLPLSRYAALAGAIATAGDQAASATATLAAAPDSFMPSMIARARWDAEAETGRLATDLDGLGALLNGASTFGGADGPQRYLVLAQNPAELRGTGGLWGAYAIMTLDHGREQVSRSRPVKSSRTFPAGRVPDAERRLRAELRRVWWRRIVAEHEHDAGLAICGACRARELRPRRGHASGRRLHGRSVRASARSWRSQGRSIAGAGHDHRDNAVDVTTNRVYTDSPGLDPAQGPARLGAAAGLRPVPQHGRTGIARLHAISGAVADGHLRIYSTDPTVEGGLAALGADGALAQPGGDIMGVTVVNGSAGKVDFYATRSVDYDIQLGGRARRSTARR